MGAFFPFLGGISQAPQLVAAARSPGDPSTVQGGGCCPFPRVSFPHESLQKHNPWCVCGGCGVGWLGGVRPHPSSDQGERRGGEVLGEPISAPAPGFAGRLEGRGRMLGQAAWCPAPPDFSPACRH